MLCLSNNHDRSWMSYGSRSKAHARRHCLGGALAKACNYVLTLWDKLTRFLEYPELELSNDLAENTMRPVALGRRNWIHIGSAQILAHRDFQPTAAFYHRKDRSDLRSRLFFLGKPSD